MIRNLKLIVGLLALGNIAGIVGLIAWLGVSDRLSVERLEAAREIFAVTIAEERREAARIEAEEAARDEELKKLGRPGTTPLHAEAVMRIINERDQTAQQRFERQEAEIATIRETLENERMALEAEERKFQDMVDRFERRRADLAEREGSEQFAKAVKIYSLCKPDEARDMMRNLIGAGEIDRVVSYLNAMKPDIAQKIISAFAEDDAALAADLLERLRSHGLEMPEAESIVTAEP
jgi:flagellar motility protein MotE (MotC chaperone)